MKRIAGAIPALQSDAGDHFHRTAAFPASLDVDVEFPLEALRLCHGCPALGGCILSSSSAPEPGLWPLPPFADVSKAQCLARGREHPIEVRPVDFGLGHQGGQSCK